MRQDNIIAQVDGWRYTYVCPRGTIAIDESYDGTRMVTRCLDGRWLTRRDIAEAVRLHTALLSLDVGKSDIVAQAARSRGADLTISRPAVVNRGDVKGLPK